MQKTGCTHITSLLSNLFDGKQIGKHNAATKKQIRNTTYFISSIRNPWDWYVSLWVFGVQGKGALMHRLTQKNPVRYFKRAIKNPKRNFAWLYYELSNDTTSFWHNVYDRPDNVESFRKWLKLILDPDNSFYLSKGYSSTEITDLCGFMTYRYLYLCCQNIREFKNSSSFCNYEDVVQFEINNCYIDFFIRQESLESDLCQAVEKVRPLNYKEKEFIYRKRKTNTSKRELSTSDYYDEQSIELVSSREKLLIDKFGYSQP